MNVIDIILVVIGLIGIIAFAIFLVMLLVGVPAFLIYIARYHSDGSGRSRRTIWRLNKTLFYVVGYVFYIFMACFMALQVVRMWREPQLRNPSTDLSVTLDKAEASKQ